MSNDYETIYIYKKWHSEIALNHLIEKYKPLIIRKLGDFRVRKEHYDDFIQELSMTVILAVEIFDESENKTFTKFLDLLLNRRIIKLLSSLSKYDNVIQEIKEHYDEIYQPEDYLSYLEKKDLIKQVHEVDLLPIEKNILNDILINNNSSECFAKKYHLSAKKVYNLTYQVKNKIKKNCNK